MKNSAQRIILTCKSLVHEWVSKHILVDLWYDVDWLILNILFLWVPNILWKVREFLS